MAGLEFSEARAGDEDSSGGDFSFRCCCSLADTDKSFIGFDSVGGCKAPDIMYCSGRGGDFADRGEPFVAVATELCVGVVGTEVDFPWLGGDLRDTSDNVDRSEESTDGTCFR